MAEKGLHLQMLMLVIGGYALAKSDFFFIFESLGCGWKRAKELMFDIQLLSHFVFFDAFFLAFNRSQRSTHAENTSGCHL